MYGCNRPFWPLPYAKAYSLELDWILAELRKLQEGGLSTPIESIIQSIEEIKATLEAIVAAPGIVYDSQKLGGHAPEYFLAPLENVQQSIDEIRAELASIVAAPGIVYDSQKLGGHAPEYFLAPLENVQQAITEIRSELDAIVASPGIVYDSQKLGGKSPKYYLTPQNLLDNSDFRNPVNQRGATTSGAFTYFIDRWITGSAGCTLSENGISLVPKCWLHQRIAKETFDTYLSNGFTFCCETSDGTVLTLNAVAGSGSGAINGVHLYVANDYLDIGGYYEFRIVTDVNTTCTVKWAALYEGSYTAETLPPYVPKPYVVELAECQRYYVRLKSGNAFYGFGSSSGSSAYLYYDLPQQMRIANPSASSSGSFYLRASSGSVTANTISNAATFGKQLEITVPVSITANTPFIGYADASVAVSADL